MYTLYNHTWYSVQKLVQYESVHCAHVCVSDVNSGVKTHPEYVGQDINKFCHVNDLNQLQKHHAEGRWRIGATGCVCVASVRHAF